MTCKDCIHYDVCGFSDLVDCDGCWDIKNKADVQEVKHGNWIFKGVHISGFAFKCSVCGRYMFANEEQCNTTKDLIKNFPFCHCGAKMKGEKK